METYRKLAEFTTRFQVLMILLADNTWPKTWLRRFPARESIAEPFRIATSSSANAWDVNGSG